MKHREITEVRNAGYSQTEGFDSYIQRSTTTFKVDKMGDKAARHVAVAIIYDQEASKVLMITSRKHPHLWICEIIKRAEMKFC
jgi:hypothetical protein